MPRMALGGPLYYSMLGAACSGRATRAKYIRAGTPRLGAENILRTGPPGLIRLLPFVG